MRLDEILDTIGSNAPIIEARAKTPTKRKGIPITDQRFKWQSRDTTNRQKYAEYSMSKELLLPPLPIDAVKLYNLSATGKGGQSNLSALTGTIRQALRGSGAPEASNGWDGGLIARTLATAMEPYLIERIALSAGQENATGKKSNVNAYIPFDWVEIADVATKLFMEEGGEAQGFFATRKERDYGEISPQARTDKGNGSMGVTMAEYVSGLSLAKLQEKHTLKLSDLEKVEPGERTPKEDRLVNQRLFAHEPDAQKSGTDMGNSDEGIGVN